jgi:hypothetical protein
VLVLVEEAVAVCVRVCEDVAVDDFVFVADVVAVCVRV